MPPLFPIALATLEETGLSLDGDPLGTFTLGGRSSGVDLVLENASVENRPGPSDDSVVVCMLRAAVPLADMIVCRASDIDRTMGALPNAERARTGHAGFDARYAVFVSRVQSEYRGADPAEVGPWAAPATLDRLMDLGLDWMRVRDGKAEIAFAGRLSVEDVGRGLAVAANVARGSRGEPLVDVRAGFRTSSPPSLPVSSLSISWGIAGVLGLIVGYCASFLEWFRAIDQEAVCGPGATLLHTESDGSDGGTHHDFHCSNAHDSMLIALHVFSCVLLMVGIFAIVVLARTAIRRASPA